MVKYTEKRDRLPRVDATSDGKLVASIYEVEDVFRVELSEGYVIAKSLDDAKEIVRLDVEQRKLFVYNDDTHEKMKRNGFF